MRSQAEALKKKQQGAKKEGKGKAQKSEDAKPEDDGPAQPETGDVAVEETAEETPEQSTSPTDASSLAQQSKIRSSSFRKGSVSVPQGPLSPGPGSPEGATAPEIYRKQVSRIDELEKENERLTRANTESEKRWKKAEGELEDLRESGDASGKHPGSGDEAEKLVGVHLSQYACGVLTT